MIFELGAALAILIQTSVGQSTVSSVYYQQMSIEVSTWSDITTAHTLAGSEHIITYVINAIFDENRMQFLISDQRKFNVQPCAQLTHNV